MTITIDEYKKSLDDTFKKIDKFGDFYNDDKLDYDLNKNLNFRDRYSVDIAQGSVVIYAETHISAYKLSSEIEISIHNVDAKILRINFSIHESEFAKLRDFINLRRNQDDYYYGIDIKCKIKINVTGIITNHGVTKPSNINYITITHKHVGIEFSVNVGNTCYTNAVINNRTIVDFLYNQLDLAHRINTVFKDFRVSDINVIFPYMPNHKPCKVPDVVRYREQIPLIDHEKYYNREIIDIKLFSTRIEITIILDGKEAIMILSNNINKLKKDLELVTPNINDDSFESIGDNQNNTLNISERFSIIERKNLISNKNPILFQAISIAIQVLEERIEQCVLNKVP